MAVHVSVLDKSSMHASLGPIMNVEPFFSTGICQTINTNHRTRCCLQMGQNCTGCSSSSACISVGYDQKRCCLQNHMPEVIVIDEIGTATEGLAARTIAQRGVQLIATAHGGHLENLMKNPALLDLIGGIERYTDLFLLHRKFRMDTPRRSSCRLQLSMSSDLAQQSHVSSTA